jgi:hypothetical protein
MSFYSVCMLRLAAHFIGYVHGLIAEWDDRECDLVPIRSDGPWSNP